MTQSPFPVVRITGESNFFEKLLKANSYWVKQILFIGSAFSFDRNNEPGVRCEGELRRSFIGDAGDRILRHIACWNPC
jgi:hypothetical protein